MILAGHHYGWPYCYDNGKLSPGWKGLPMANCADARYTAPALLLPPHAAPLAMLWYEGSMFPLLQGKLLVVHGSGDDNVHYKSTEVLVNALIAAKKQFTMMEYPNRRHDISQGQNTTRHVYGLLTSFLEDNLPAGPSGH